jgi:hypothetical protein
VTNIKAKTATTVIIAIEAMTAIGSHDSQESHDGHVYQGNLTIRQKAKKTMLSLPNVELHFSYWLSLYIFHARFLPIILCHISSAQFETIEMQKK